jgi:CBASS immunity sensor of nucleotide second messenger signals
MNRAYVAHVVARSPNGLRGDQAQSPHLAGDLANLMLLCDEHHRLIDREGLAEHPVELLRQMKCEHEERIETVTSINRSHKSHILLYGANVGSHSSPVSNHAARLAVLDDGWYPAPPAPLELGMANSSFQDCTDSFWQIEAQHLRTMVQQQVRPRLANRDIRHLSIFALAPQPLLILLGYLLSDIPAAQVYQLHREPPDWCWQKHPARCEYTGCGDDRAAGEPALALSLSGTITGDRVAAVLGEDAAVWRISIPEPHNDFLRSRQQLRQFRQTVRPLMDRIKARHGQSSVLHVFPAVPVSVAVEFGRIIMPKADMPLRIYDQNNGRGGFVPVLDIDLVGGDSR